mgnify:CR=1 FL=1
MKNNAFSGDYIQKYSRCKQLFRSMKISTALLLVGALGSYAGNVHSQSAKVNLQMDQVSLNQILNEIESQTNYMFLYNNHVNVDRTTSIHAKDESVSKVLSIILEGTDIKYELAGEHIILTNGNAKTASAVVQKKTIKGKVIDAQGEAIIGANVRIKGTSIGTITDIDGNFTLEVTPNSVIEISYIGYVSQEVNVKGNTPITVKLIEDTKNLDEVVVVGYGTQKKVNLTGSVASINSEVIENVPAANLSSALSGRLAGVNITQTAGKPGGGSSLSIRADGTWNSTTPLYVIDGVVRDKFAFDGLDASEVESLSVLKDGASAAIYGSRAANGVILVNTKKGKQGKPTINYTGSIGIEEATKIPDMFNAYEQALYVNASLRNDQVPEGDIQYYADDELEYLKNHSYDWIDETWKSPVVTRHSLNVNGGNDKVRYFIGGNYYYETGSFDNLNFKKYSIRSSVEANITKDLKASLSFNTDTRNDHKPYWKWDNDNDNNNLYNGLLRRGIFAPYIDGKPNGTYLKWHPMEVLNGNSGYNKKRYSNYEINVSLQYDVPFVKGLSLKLAYNKYERHTFIKQFSRPYDLYVFKTTGSHNHIQTNELDYITTRDDGDFLYESYTNNNSYQLNAMATYSRTFGKHDINALFVYEQYEGNTDWISGQRNYFISSAVDQLFAGSSDPKDSTVNGSGSESGRLSYVGRLGYTYDNKYLLEASFRYDGSVNFAPKHRWGFFPSASLAWRISEENFFKNNIRFIDYLKLRGSIGLLGNDAVGGWQWMQRYNLTTGAYFGSLSNGVSASVTPNAEITWEKSMDVDYGFDMQILQNRLSLSAGGFYKHTYDILGSRLASLPSTFGGSMPQENYATIDTKGFEIELSYKDKIGKEFTYNINANFGYAVNKLINQDEAENIRPYRSKIGYNTDRQMGYVSTGIIRTQADLDALPEGYTIFGKKPELGMLNYKDIRGADSDEPDGKIDSNDQEWVIKHTKAPINYGFSVGGAWKGLSVDLFFQGIAGGKRFYDQRTEWAEMESSAYAWRGDYWTPENPSAKFPRAGSTNGASEASTFWIQDTSFLRLKNVNITYQLPRQLVSKWGLSQLKFFLMGTNLFLLQDKIKAYDPENSSIMNYPLMRTYSFGVNVSF